MRARTLHLLICLDSVHNESSCFCERKCSKDYPTSIKGYKSIWLMSTPMYSLMILLHTVDLPPGNTMELPGFSKYLYFLFVPTLIYRDKYPRYAFLLCTSLCARDMQCILNFKTRAANLMCFYVDSTAEIRWKYVVSNFAQVYSI